MPENLWFTLLLVFWSWHCQQWGLYQLSPGFQCHVFDQETQRRGEVRCAVSCYVMIHVGRHGSCFAETGWSEQKLETQRDRFKRCGLAEKGCTQAWLPAYWNWQHPGVVVTELPADPSQVQQMGGRGQMLPSASDRTRGCSPQASLPAAVTLATASVLREERV